MTLTRKTPMKRKAWKPRKARIRPVNPERRNRRRGKYLEYLRSAAWKAKRAERLQIDRRTCQHCGYCPDTASPDTPKRPLDIDHKTYIRFGHEDVERDLQTLCRPCHKAKHAGESWKYRSP